jgi:hypothetical protein
VRSDVPLTSDISISELSAFDRSADVVQPGRSRPGDALLPHRPTGGGRRLVRRDRRDRPGLGGPRASHPHERPSRGYGTKGT